MDERARRLGEQTRLVHELRTVASVVKGRLQLRCRQAHRRGTAVTLTAEDLVAFEDALARLATAIDDVDRELDHR